MELSPAREHTLAPRGMVPLACHCMCSRQAACFGSRGRGHLGLEHIQMTVQKCRQWREAHKVTCVRLWSREQLMASQAGLPCLLSHVLAYGNIPQGGFGKPQGSIPTLCHLSVSMPAGGCPALWQGQPSHSQGVPGVSSPPGLPALGHPGLPLNLVLEV